MKARIEYFPEENPNPELSVEKDGSVLYSNKAGDSLLHEWGLRIGEKIPSSIRDTVKRVISRNSPEKIEVKVGKKVYLVMFQPLPEEGFVNIYGFDISDQKMLEEKFREREEKYRIVADNTFDWEFWQNPDGRFLYMSPSCERVTGYAAQEFMDKPDLLQKIIHSDDRQAFLQHTHDMPLSRHGDIEFRIVTKDGGIRWIHHLCQPVHDGKGCYAGNRCSNRDVTERKQEEHRIRRYNRILEGINWIFNNVVQAKTEEELGETCLSVALEITGSEFGYVIEMGADGLLHDVAKSRLAWEQCHMYDKTGHFCLPHDYVVRGLYGSVIINEKSILTNDPQSHPDSRGLPQGHPPITSFLGVLLTIDGKIVGSIAVANREGGYSHEQQEDLEAIAPAVTQVLQRRKVEQERKLAEQELKASEMRFRALVQDLDSGVILIDGEGKFAIYNPAFLQIFNISELELEHMKIQDLSWDTWNVIDKNGNALSFESHPVQYTRINRKPVKNQVIGIRRYSHEDWVWTLASAEPLLNPDGSINIIICTLTDITQLKNTEDALRIANESLEEKVKERTTELEEAYNSLIEREEILAEAQKMAHVGNWVWDIYTDKAYWSEEQYRIFGRSPQESALTYNEYLNCVHPDDRKYVVDAFQKAINGISYSIDYRIILPNGEERTIHSKAEVIFDKKSAPIRVKGIVQDITERRKAEEKLRESEEKYRNIVETANEGITLLDSGNRITFVNKKLTDMLGYISEEMMGKTVLDFIDPEYMTISKSKIKERHFGNSVCYETKLICKDGSHLWVFVSAKSLIDEHGKFIGSLSMLTDITKRKEAEETLRNLEIARKKELHHRIKNNLQVISSLLDLQADLFKGRENIKDSEVLKAFKQSIDRVLSIALIHEELYKGKNVELLNFSQYIKELAENLLLTYKLDIDVNLNFDLEENIFLDMDIAIPLGIAINEIVTNSFKYAFSGRDNGDIRIKLHRDECKSSNFTLSVSDNGVGIPGDLDIKDLDSLGLQLVTTLVEQLDGEFELKRDKGTEFIIRLTATENNNLESVASIPQFIDNN